MLEPKRIQGYEELLNLVAPDKGSWVDAVTPIVKRYEIGAKFGHEVVYNPTGSDALAKLMMSMARILDSEIMARKNQDAG